MKKESRIRLSKDGCCAGCGKDVSTVSHHLFQDDKYTGLFCLTCGKAAWDAWRKKNYKETT